MMAQLPAMTRHQHRGGQSICMSALRMDKIGFLRDPQEKE